MGADKGEVWLWLADGERPDWIERTELSVLSERGVAGPSDCVLHVGRPPKRHKAVTRAGASRGNGLSAWRMNALTRAIAALRPEEIERRLRREGMAARIDESGRGRGGFGNGKGAMLPFAASRRYAATVFGLEAVEIRRAHVFEQNHDRELGEKVRWLLAKAAARALYVLGLDFGQVELELTDQGRVVIVSVSPDMRPLPGGGEQLLAEAIRIFVKSWKAEAKSGVSVTLGADPEFVLLSPEGKVVPASRYFPPDGAAGCDSVVVRGVRRWPLAELRPEPADEPDALAADVRRLLATAARMTSGEPLSWLAGGAPVRGLPLGGHIHLSGAALTGERLRALDNAVALPLRLLEPPSAQSRRPRYGSLGDFRKQPHGGFEYRTPPSWLVSRLVARGAMALSKVAAEHSRELSAFRPLDEEAVREAFYGGDREVLAAACERVCEGIVRTSGYRAYAALIDPLFDAIRDRRTWSETDDFRRKWGIVVKP